MLLREPKAFEPFADCGPELSHTLDRLGGYAFGMLNLLVMSQQPDKPLTIVELSEKFVAAQGLPPSWTPDEDSFRPILDEHRPNPFIITRRRAVEGRPIEGLLSEQGLTEAIPVAAVALSCQLDAQLPSLRALLGDPNKQVTPSEEFPLGAPSARFGILRYIKENPGMWLKDVRGAIQPHTKSSIYQMLYRLRDLGVIEVTSTGHGNNHSTCISEPYAEVVHRLVDQLVDLNTDNGQKVGQECAKDLLRFEQDFSYLSLLAYDARQGRGK